MAQTTPNMQLTVWNLLSDPYDSSQLAQNFVAIDQHDHSGSGKGAPIDGKSALVNGSITSAKLASPSVNSGHLVEGAITTEKIADSTGSTDGITTAKIATSAVTNDKIANGTINRIKLSSTAKTIPMVYHASTNGSLPSVTNEGEPLYEGYTIDYCFMPTKPASDQGYVLTSPNTNAHIWRLRYDNVGKSWDFMGGAPIIIRSSTNATSNTSSGNPLTVKTWYNGWGGRTFQSFKTPLKGVYTVNAQATMSANATTKGTNSQAVMQMALDLGSTTTATALNDSAVWASVLNANATGNDSFDYATLSLTDFIWSVSTKSNNANQIKQIFGMARADTALVYGATIHYQSLSLLPRHGLNNFA